VAGTCASVLPATIFQVSFGVTQVLSPTSSQNADYSFAPIQTAIAGGTNPQYVFSQPVRLYADPGTSLTAGIGVDSGPVSPSNSCGLVFSGHLVTTE